MASDFIHGTTVCLLPLHKAAAGFSILYSRLLYFIMAAVSAAVLSVTDCSGRDRTFSYRGFSGGMMLHAGYVSGKPFEIIQDGSVAGVCKVEGAAYGIGGLAKFHFGTAADQLRLGIEGYSTNVGYTPHGSYASTGWGGLTVDYIRQAEKGRVSPFVGVTVGGGGTKNHVMIGGDSSDFATESAFVFRRYTFMAIAPFIGIEISVGKRLRIVAKADYLLHAASRVPDFPSGVRLYFGLLFCRYR
ncbi:MAG TPA: hypothetical protein IAC34_01810 [Candidatus Coprenecus stercoripullorum]|nr:hypothetical protein [Candidatus Coprenecus stercoripullorum]